MSDARFPEMPARSRQDRWDASLVVAITFPFFMLTALGRRLATARTSRPGGILPLFTEARTAAKTCAAFALMG